MKFDNSLKIICLESDAFYALVNTVVERVKEDLEINHQQWISDDEAMLLLKIKSKTTLQKLRDTGSIRYSQPMKKVILYDRASILDFLDKNANETF